LCRSAGPPCKSAGGAAALPSQFATAYQRVRASVIEDWLDDMIDITDRDDLGTRWVSA